MTPEITVIVTAVLAIFNGEIASPIISWLKKQLKIEGGIKALLLTIIEIMAVTAGYLVFVTKSFSWGTLVLCSAYAFMRASGIYTVKKNGTPT
jgi:hypothetical protein